MKEYFEELHIGNFKLAAIILTLKSRYALSQSSPHMQDADNDPDELE
jgi:hypothetical protein